LRRRRDGTGVAVTCYGHDRRGDPPPQALQEDRVEFLRISVVERINPPD
jgi:hypothetical protein